MLRALHWLLLGLSLLGASQAALAQQVCKYDSIPATAPASRFTDNGDGTVTDKLTGLQWKRCNEGQIWDSGKCIGVAPSFEWQEALIIAAAAQFAGHTDWRLPNIKELASVLENACTYPAVNEAVFSSTTVGGWSATPTASYDPTNNIGYGAHLISFSSGGERALNRFVHPQSVLLVRGENETVVNDTGVDWWVKNHTIYLDYEDQSHPGQDASFGRDRSFDDDSDGHAGFSFTKLDQNGSPLPADASNWLCVRDEVTGLTWEVKRDDGGLHDRDDKYVWYNTDGTRNGGLAGWEDGGENCYGYDVADAHSYCNTEAFASRVNKEGLCGKRDWRVPEREELRSIVDYSRSRPAIDTRFSLERSIGARQPRPLTIGQHLQIREKS